MPSPDGAPHAAPILIVSADPGIRARCRAILEGAGLPAEAEPDGIAAILRMVAARPALVLLDWALPGIAPAVVAASAREAFGETLPIVLLASDECGPRQATALGTAGWVREPADAGTLRAAVRAAIGIG